MSAVEGLHPDTMKLLVDKGADPLQPDSIPQNAMVKYFLTHPWELAKDPGFPDRDRACLQFLLDHGLKIEGWNKSTIYTERKHLMEFAPELYPVKEFEEAAEKGEWAKVFKMIDDGMSPDAPAVCGGITPLIHAITNDDIDVLNTLLDKGAALETGTRYMTPVMHAAMAGAEKCFNRLVRAGADITRKYGDDWDGWTTLVELAQACKTNPNMGAYAVTAIAHKDDPVEINIDAGTDHKVKVHAPLHFRHAPAMG
jgi:ankyrin repeat protein